MDKFKSLLLPLALIFAAIAVFELGVRYGSTNMRAYAIAGELRLPLRAYAQGLEQTGSESTDNPQLAALIDTGIAAGSIHRQIWYLDKQAKAVLDQTLAYAFVLRGDSIVQRLEDPEASKGLQVSNTSPAKLRAAVGQAMQELKALQAAAASDPIQESTEPEVEGTPAP
ncbi:hypothetical protein [Coraliomargarita akajimensis]|uniref:Uncharacterized protein n=1 Tax=Coraliomargarita akajimensis (strain DSM 45221 / IAM 15411 / JCM 23193 / KCTC 12865 / 04OKA010-24) TaxID=583355 RepID=D5EM66_CORAD|nr:hypothetical protein [Coraliomargarita akajimensis]ADE55226.1 hypothetical protein Caka_2209 [Coraliomargarita akajimensis DSM 45221]